MTIRNLLTGDTGFAPFREGEGGGGGGNPPATWIPEGTDPELIGHIQNRGLDKKTAVEAAIELGKSHREAERYIGTPPERLLKLPADANDEAGWKIVWKRLGAPDDAKAYDPVFTDIKFKDGTDLDQPFVDVVRSMAVKNHWSPDTAKAVAKELVTFVEKGDEQDKVVSQAELAANRKKLIDDWGVANVEANLVIARAAAAKFGVTPEQIAAAEKMMGYTAVMQMFHKLGVGTGEDKFLRDNNGGNPVLSKEQAIAKRKELEADADWRKRFLGGGVAERKEHEALIAIEKG